MYGVGQAYIAAVLSLRIDIEGYRELAGTDCHRLIGKETIAKWSVDDYGAEVHLVPSGASSI